MRNSIDWSEWILQKNNEAKQEKKREEIEITRYRPGPKPPEPFIPDPAHKKQKRDRLPLGTHQVIRPGQMGTFSEDKDEKTHKSVDSANLTNSVKEELLEKQKYLPRYDTVELVKPNLPEKIDVPSRQHFLNESVKAAQQGRIPQGDVPSHADRVRASAVRRADAQNQKAISDYNTNMGIYNAQADYRPKNVVSGHRLHGIDDTGAGASVAGTGYQIMTDYPEHMGKESHVGVKHAHNDPVASKLRIRTAKNHILTLRRQGDNTAYQVHVTPEQYKKAMMTGWHDDSESK